MKTFNCRPFTVNCCIWNSWLAFYKGLLLFVLGCLSVSNENILPNGRLTISRKINYKNRERNVFNSTEITEDPTHRHIAIKIPKKLIFCLAMIHDTRKAFGFSCRLFKIHWSISWSGVGRRRRREWMERKNKFTW